MIRAAMIHNHTAHAHGTWQVTDPALVLFDGDDHARWVTSWGRALAMLARADHIAAIHALEATLPDNGAAVLKR